MPATTATSGLVLVQLLSQRLAALAPETRELQGGFSEQSSQAHDRLSVRFAAAPTGAVTSVRNTESPAKSPPQ